MRLEDLFDALKLFSKFCNLRNIPIGFKMTTELGYSLKHHKIGIRSKSILFARATALEYQRRKCVFVGC